MKLKQLFHLVCLTCFFFACSHEVAELNPAYQVAIIDTVVIKPIDSNGGGSSIIDTTINTCNTDTVYFASQFFPLIQSSCAMSGCHDAITKADGIVLTDYTNIMKIVKAGNPSNSKLYESLVEKDIKERMPLLPVPPFTQTQIALVYKWIQQGAKNNACTNTNTSACVTTNMSFATHILPIFATNCNGCHNATIPAGGINLTTYNGTKAISARLLGSISHTTGFIPMPSSTTKLAACDINKIAAWISQGTLNN
jgi:hypothetical protein